MVDIPVLKDLFSDTKKIDSVPLKDRFSDAKRLILCY